MDRIAASAEVSKVTLYKYFPSKEALFNAIVNEPIRHAFSLDLEGLDPADPSSSLLRIAERYLELITSAEILGHVRLLHGSAPANPSLGAAFLKTGPEAIVDALVRYLRATTAQRVLRIPNAPQAAEQFVGMVRGNEQIRMLLGQPALRGRSARRRYCKSCVTVFVKAFAP
jgi:TetR/AcrR family transcriptional repressor of mexJK operon